jgi:predicted SnoaL-like aldol condensation-catalyzing enzyme
MAKAIRLHEFVAVRTVLAGLAIGAVIAAASACASYGGTEREVARTNTQTVLAFEETVYNKHQVKQAFARYVGSTYRQHDLQVPDGQDGAIQALSSELANVFPKSRMVVQRTVAQGDLVAVQVFWDQQPGETRGVAMVDLYRVENGKIVERWAVVGAPP